MPRIEFVIEGSQGDPYDVVFDISEGIARATCSCQAGANGQFCKHRMAMLDGDISSLRSANASSVAKLASLLEGTNLASAYADLVTAAKAHEETKRALDAAKRRLTRIAHQ
ncbi:SWIM zinc finger family protein [Falsiroseomonas sp.]|uniref:SWIM zinc finger family protein n=1 Tax=Falsiroseomonas sp. TaxID=2870721 RepID=UPI002727ABD0|nr:SWIM zinc finger family protein [Falsiroseomonas sp.]MDO9501992.1 SWIM zinc finger family protein [Falsiroseomonas sp.]